ncbi:MULTISPECIES: TetR family transcriptional regulator [unclassified Myxococcus]|uniref:TetR family transcriptional regulator n=1 Tax=Myxococcus TaxID=32 RepID=UPI0011417EF5|nr:MULTISPECIES: TetR family transcriptional regulator [unclassified Myxococcus]NOK00652.1 TetR family transcriptional regulator [Myxococcus xanthus]
MSPRRSPRISTRKEPQQARSNELVEAVLRAAIQVLAKEGAPRFTMARVAEKAGVSVGSLYQYFPNKAAVLFRLQTDEWRQTTALTRELLEDTTRPPLARLRALVHTFVQSECDEAAVRVALSDAAPLYRDAPEARAVRASSKATFEAFMREVLPATPKPARMLAGDLIMTTLSSVGKSFSESPRTPAEIATYSDALADMLCAYLKTLSAAPSGKDVATSTAVDAEHAQPPPPRRRSMKRR